MKSNFLVRVALCLTMFAGFAACAHAQTTGSISGTVSDATGAVVKGATVKLIDTDRGETIRTLTTNGDGFYTATSLPLGTYTVEIDDKGFKTEDVTGLVLHAADALTVNRKLVAGGATEVISVRADEAQLNLQDATSAGLINATQIGEMPLSTRNYESLLNLQPGVTFGGSTDQLARGPVGVDGASSTVAFSVNGGRTTSNGWTIDGADNLDRGANLTPFADNTAPSSDAMPRDKSTS